MIDLTSDKEVGYILGEYVAEEITAEKLPGTIQWCLSLFAFILAFPSVNIAGISITFFIFFFILTLHIKKRITIISRDKTNKWFILLFASGLISTIFHPPLDIEVSVLSDIKTISQYFYWIFLAMYLRSNFRMIDWWRFSRSLFWGLCALVIGYYFLPVRIDLIIFEINFDSSRNGFVYNFLCYFPVIFWYLNFSFLKRISPVLLILFVLSILFSNGRAGFVLIIIQTLLMGLIIYPSLDRVFKAGLAILVVIFTIWQVNSESEITSRIAKIVEQASPRMAATINREGTEGDLSTDKSWLLRRLMVDKTIEIVKEYPALGLGWMHFEKYYAELKTQGNYPRLSGQSNIYLNTRSSHNSYAMYLAEGGIFGFTLLLIILVSTLYPFFIKLFRNDLTFMDLPLVALVTLIIYFYAITSITGAGTWFVIGTSLGCVRSYNKETWE